MVINMAAKTLLIVAHAPSPNTKKLAQAAYDGANHPDIDINVILKLPQDTQPADVLAADALLLGTTENLAYMAGLTKDFFDRSVGWQATNDISKPMPITHAIKMINLSNKPRFCGWLVLCCPWLAVRLVLLSLVISYVLHVKGYFCYACR